MLFAGVAGITSQLFESARAASGLAGLFFGMSFLLKAVGDAFGKIAENGLSVKTNIVSWFSPLGWATNMRPFAGEMWWVLGLFTLALPLIIMAAYILLSHRDIGSGLFATKAGRLH